MKHSFVILAFFLLVASVMIERGGLSWQLERPLLHWLAQKTNHMLPSVTALVLPTNEHSDLQVNVEGSEVVAPLLEAQDVALALRAIVSFHPRLILIAAPLEQRITAPLGLLRDAQIQGMVQATPCLFAALPNEHARYEAVDLICLPNEKNLIPLVGEVRWPGSFGFIATIQEKKQFSSMPLFGVSPNENIIASLWWRGLNIQPQKQDAPSNSVFFIGARMLLFPNKNVIWLEDDSCLKLEKLAPCPVVFLDDLLLRREEMERGEIKPDLELIFRNKTVIIGGVEAPFQGAVLQDAQQRIHVKHLTTSLYALLLVLLTFALKMLSRLSIMNVGWMIFSCMIFYATAVFFAFYFLAVLLPLIMPSSLMIIIFSKRK